MDGQSNGAVFSEEDCLLKEYSMLMSSLEVSVSKHLMKDDLEVIWGNDYFYKLTGYPKEEFEECFHNSCENYFAEDRREYDRLFDMITSAHESGQPGYEAVVHMPQKGGTCVWIKLVGTFTEEYINGYMVIYTVFTSINDLVNIKKEQMVTYDKLPGFAARMRIGEDGLHLIYSNKKFKCFFGNQNGEDWNDLLQENMKQNAEVLQLHYRAARRGESVTFQVTARDIKGCISYFKVYGERVDWYQEDPIYLVLFMDVTEMTLQRERLHQLAYVDPVTGGRNRTSFSDAIGAAVRQAPPAAYVLVSLDIQKFKVINELFGIEAGDKTLSYVYWKMFSQLREGEYAARLSADTFNMLLKAEERSVLEERITALARDMNQFNEELVHKYFLVLVAGIYIIDDPSLPVTGIQDRANMARKQIKGVLGAKLCVCNFYSSEDGLRMAREKGIENRMQSALKNNEFVVYLQPKQNLYSGKTAGAEALVRWLDPEKGLIPPDEFIPLFEKNGFIIELDLYVFAFVCRLLKRWIEEGRTPVPISVNMSRVHLSHENFLENYEKIRREYNIPPKLLEIEITETLVFENPQLLAEVIEQIHSNGYQCSMDDFGSGYSSLNVLKDIRVDTLKLDRAFFSSDCMDNPWETAIISGVVELARKLQMRTVAEGVETKAQAEFLKQTGCDELQGYLYSRPVPVEQFEQFVFGEQETLEGEC